MLFCFIILVVVVPITISGNERQISALTVPAFYQSHSNIKPWTSDHWYKTRRVLSSRNRDKYDPSRLSQCRGSRKPEVVPEEGHPQIILDKGVMKMSGYQVRLYINPDLISYSNRRLKWPARNDEYYLNTEISVYYKRTGTDGKSGAGLVIGCRSNSKGHAKPVINYKNTHTYYARFRHDGKVDFVKEMTHPKSEYIYNGVNHTHGELFNDDDFPSDVWYGMKFIVYNLDTKRVKLELYIDKKSHADPDKIDNINNWEMVDELVDDGTTFQAPVYANYTAHTDNGFKPITKGGGTIFIRNTDIQEASYKYFSVRELKYPVVKIAR